MIDIHTDRYGCEYKPDQGYFSLESDEGQLLTNFRIRLAVEYRWRGRKYQALHNDWPNPAITKLPGKDPQGTLTQIDTHLHLEHLPAKIFFSQTPLSNLFLWKLHFENHGDDPIWIDRIEMLRSGGIQDEMILSPASQWTFFSNGWQSWSRTGAYPSEKAMRHSRMGPIQNPMIYNPGTPAIRQPGYFTSDFFGVLANRSSRQGLLAGFLSQKQQFGSIEAVLYDRPSLRVWANGDGVRLDPGNDLETDWAVLCPIDLDSPDPLGEYLAAAAKENNVFFHKESPAGWCSWYHFYTNLKAEDIRSNLSAIQQSRQTLPLDLVQIDDGFEAQVGDWYEFKPGFPDGVQILSQEIKEAGFLPGLWLAPFILHPNAKFTRENPHLLLRNQRGNPVTAGFGWNSFTRALDLSIPEAQEFAIKMIRTAAHEWGYPYLKLDFLYAGALEGQRMDPTRTRAQILREAMQAIRDAAGPETILLGCGAPLGSVLGLVDAMRIGADVSGTWDPEYNGIRIFFRDEPHMPSARNSIQNILTRAPLHNRWWVNDPDCLLVRPDTRLTLPEVQTLATVIGLTGGSLLISDDLPSLPAERLRLAQVLLPVIGQTAQIIDLFDSETPEKIRLDLNGPIGTWTVLAVCNWSEQAKPLKFSPIDFHLAPGSYYIRSFWDGYANYCEEGQSLDLPILPPHGTALLAVYPDLGTNVQFIGSDFHISQGLEVREWSLQDGLLSLKLDLKREASGDFYLTLPNPPVEATINGLPLGWEMAGFGKYRFRVNLTAPGDIQIKF